MIPRNGFRSTDVSSKTCCSSSASFQSGSIGDRSSDRRATSRIGTIAIEPTVATHDLALLLFHPRTTALAMMHPFHPSGATIDRAIVHGRSVASSTAASQPSAVPYTEPMGRRIFILSPARCDGERAQMVLSPHATFALARRMREGTGAPLGDVMSFLSGLYFRGKLTYAEAFARPPAGTGAAGVLVITTNAGLQPPSLPLTVDALRRAAKVDIDARTPRYRRPLELSAAALAERL